MARRRTSFIQAHPGLVAFGVVALVGVSGALALVVKRRPVEAVSTPAPRPVAALPVSAPELPPRPLAVKLPDPIPERVEPVARPARPKTEPTPAPIAPKQPATLPGTLDAHGLVHEFYTANQVDTDLRYKGKELTVEGEVTAIFSHPNGTATLRVDFLWFGFTTSTAPTLRDLKTGAKVKVSGVCLGRRLPTPENYPVLVLFADSRLLRVNAPGSGRNDFGSFLEDLSKR